MEARINIKIEQQGKAQDDQRSAAVKELKTEMNCLARVEEQKRSTEIRELKRQLEGMEKSVQTGFQNMKLESENHFLRKEKKQAS